MQNINYLVVCPELAETIMNSLKLNISTPQLAVSIELIVEYRITLLNNCERYMQYAMHRIVIHKIT